VLFLYSENPTAQTNLRKEAVRAGIDPGRLIFGGALPLPEHLARYRSMDLFLDTLPQNAGATASDALWAGLPVLTRMGEAFAGRMAASVLTAIDVPELIASSQEQYETLAVELALDPRRLAKIKGALEQNRSSAPLFDIGRFTRHLEAGYLTIHQRHQAGLPPADLHAEAGR
jgi:predicted O-linked N-acetylglucosamine transferase (SPINDLY family)